MKSQKGCGQVNIPAVDNTSLECEEFVYDTCVKVKNEHRGILPGRGHTLDQVLDKVGNNFREVNAKLLRVGKHLKEGSPQTSEAVTLTSPKRNLGLLENSNLEVFATKVDDFVGTIRDSVGGVKTQIDSNASEINSNKGKISVLSNDILSVKRDVLEVSERLTKVDEKFNSVGASFNTVNGRFRDLSKTIQVVEDKVNLVNTKTENIDYRKVKINERDSYLGLTKDASLEGVISAIKYKLQDLSEQDDKNSVKIVDAESRLKKSSNMVVDKQLPVVGTKINTPLSTVLGKVDEQIGRLLNITTAEIPVASGKISTSSLDLFLEEVLEAILDLQTKHTALKEQYNDLKNQLKTLRIR